MRVNIKFVIFVYHIAYIHFSYTNLMLISFREHMYYMVIISLTYSLFNILENKKHQKISMIFTMSLQ